MDLSLFNITLEQHLAMSDKEKFAFADKVWQENGPYIEKLLKQRQAEWVMLGRDGQVLKTGDDYDHLPSRDEIMAICKQYGVLCQCYCKPSLIEEAQPAGLEVALK